jgi:calcyclin binding protein
MEEIKSDISEIERLIAQCTRVNVKRLLNSELAALKSKLDHLNQVKEEKESIAQAHTEKKLSEKVTLFEPIKHYSWDEQTSGFVSINVKLLNIKKHDAANIKATFLIDSFELIVLDFEGKNWKLSIPKLHSKIDQSKSNFVVKQNYIIVNLAKQDKMPWKDLHYNKAQDTIAKPDKNEDPQQGLANMMKKMYEEGDDNMKRTIAEAWTKARENPKKGEF